MITILAGDNAYMIRRELDKRRSAFVAEHDAIALEQLDGEDLTFDRLNDALVSVPFLATHKMVIVSGLSQNKLLAEKIVVLLASVPDFTDLLIVEGHLDKRTVFYKTLQKQPGFVACHQLDEQSLTRWLASEVKDQHGTISAADARYLIERVGPNQMRLAHEIDKLLLTSTVINREHIDELVERSPQSTVFELLDAAFAGQAERALRLYREQRQLRVEPQAILGLIVWQLQALAVVKAAGTRQPNDIAREAGMSPYTVRKSQGIARQITMQQLKEYVSRTLEIDVQLKTQAIDASDALENLLLLFANGD